MKQLIAQLDQQFAELHRNACELAVAVHPNAVPPSEREVSFREYLRRAAGVVEQTFGGVTANLWDDPFEWTLPETLNTPALLIAYLDEVEATRRRAFDSLNDDADLGREIVVPSGERVTLLSLFQTTIERAVTFQNSAIDIRDLPSAREVAID